MFSVSFMQKYREEFTDVTLLFLWRSCNPCTWKPCWSWKYSSNYIFSDWKCVRDTRCIFVLGRSFYFLYSLKILEFGGWSVVTFRRQANTSESRRHDQRSPECSPLVKWEDVSHDWRRISFRNGRFHGNWTITWE